MGLIESCREKNIKPTALTPDLASELQKVAADLSDETEITQLVFMHYSRYMRDDPELDSWREKFDSLQYEQRRQLKATFFAYSRAGITTVGDLRNLQQKGIQYVQRLPEIGMIRYKFIKELFPISSVSQSR